MPIIERSEDRHKAKILYIEDDFLMMKTYKDKFDAAGYELIFASNHEGLEIAKAQRPDLILMDVVMAKMDGLEILERLKLNPLTQRIPVIMMTSLDQIYFSEQAEKLGAVAIIDKSKVTPDDVLKKVEENLTSSK